jgi:hypothetical protein
VVLSHPTINPVRVRTLTKIPKLAHRAWRDQDGIQHHEAVIVSSSYVETLVPYDNLVKLREQSR